MAITLNGTTGITSTGITETSDGNVGFGTSSPLNRLTTRATANSYAGGNLSLESAGGANATYFAQTTLGDFYISNGGGADHIKLDSAGRVTMPYQPSFMATSSQNNQSGIINFDGTHYNVGGHFSTSTNKFTAPVAGTYFFSWSTVMGSNISGSTIQIRKNGTSLSYTAVYTGDNLSAHQTYPSSTICVIHYLSVGDYVEVYASPTIQANYGGFVGYLIG